MRTERQGTVDEAALGSEGVIHNKCNNERAGDAENSEDFRIAGFFAAEMADQSMPCPFLEKHRDFPRLREKIIDFIRERQQSKYCKCGRYL